MKRIIAILGACLLSGCMTTALRVIDRTGHPEPYQCTEQAFIFCTYISVPQVIGPEKFEWVPLNIVTVPIGLCCFVVDVPFEFVFDTLCYPMDKYHQMQAEKEVGARGPRTTYDNLDLGIPGPSDKVIDREGYALGYSEKNKQPFWVTYRLTRGEVETNLLDRTNDFRPDPLIENSPTPNDYIRSGYDRGHIAPAADFRWSTNAMHESFYMSNMSPQTPALNRDLWMRAERYTRLCAKQEGSVYVVSGPIITNENPEAIGESKVIVPDAFYKIIYDITPPEKMMAFVMPNVCDGKDDIWNYATNVVYVEDITGFCFFPLVETNKLNWLKAEYIKGDWPVFDPACVKINACQNPMFNSTNKENDNGNNKGKEVLCPYDKRQEGQTGEHARSRPSDHVAR